MSGPGLEPQYLAYFACFNRGLFFEAHEVLEEIWLPERGRPRDLFYKGLIQLAGAFVHLTKNRPAPAAALLRLARANLRHFSPRFDSLDVAKLLVTIDEALRPLEAGPLESGTIRPPRLELS